MALIGFIGLISFNFVKEVWGNASESQMGDWERDMWLSIDVYAHFRRERELVHLVFLGSLNFVKGRYLSG